MQVCIMTSWLEGALKKGTSSVKDCKGRALSQVCKVLWEYTVIRWALIGAHHTFSHLFVGFFLWT